MTPFEIVYSTAAVRSVNASGIISTLSLTSTDSVYIAKHGIKNAEGFCTDSSGNVYVGDLGNHVIWKINPAGVVTRVAGTGSAGNTGNGGAATSAEISSPAWLAVDTSGNVYFIDADYYIIRCVNAQATTQIILGVSIGASEIETVAGISGEFGNTGNGGAATSAKISADSGIAVDASGNLWMCNPDSFHVIRKVNSSTGVISIAVGTGTGGSTGDGGPYGLAELNGPAGIAFDTAGNLYIADNYAFRIRAINFQGSTQVLAGTSVGAGDIETVAGTGTQGTTGEGGQATSAELYYPNSIAVDASGNLFLSDNALIRMVNTSGIINAVAGNETSGSNGDGGPATSAEIGGFPIVAIASPELSPPAISSISPTSGPAAGGEPITITGQNFQTGATVLFGPTPATSVVVVSATTITAVVPSLAPGVVMLKVTNPDSQSASIYFGAIAPQANGIVRNSTGPVVAGAQVFVLNPSSELPNVGDAVSTSGDWALLSVYSDPYLTQPISQPAVTSGLGQYNFYAEASFFTLVVAYGGTVQQVYVGQELGQPAADFHLAEWWVSSNTGPSIPGAQVFVVRQPYPNIPSTLQQGQPSPLAQLYSDPLGEDPITQPLITDGFGYTSAYVEAGTYSVLVYFNGGLLGAYEDQNVDASPVYERYDGWVVNAQGASQAGAQIVVVPQGTPTTTIYSDSNGLIPVSRNTVVTDANGHYAFYASFGVYTISIYGSTGSLLYVLTNQTLSSQI